MVHAVDSPEEAQLIHEIALILRLPLEIVDGHSVACQKRTDL